MEDGNTYTVTIIKNVGRPISFTIHRSKVILLAWLSSIIFTAFCYLSVLYWFQRIETSQLQREIRDLEIKIERYQKQIHQQDQELVFTEEEQINRERVKAAMTNQADFNTKGIWANRQQKNPNIEDVVLGTSVEATKFDAYLKGEKLILKVTLKNISNPYQQIGGYYFITLIYRGESETLYRSFNPQEKLGANGFPGSYRSGAQFFLKRKPRTYTRRVKMENVSDFYTEATVFAYSFRGRLLNKQTFPMNKSIFLVE